MVRTFNSLARSSPWAALPTSPSLSSYCCVCNNPFVWLAPGAGAGEGGGRGAAGKGQSRALVWACLVATLARLNSIPIGFKQQLNAQRLPTALRDQWPPSALPTTTAKSWLKSCELFANFIFPLLPARVYRERHYQTIIDKHGN